MGQERVQTVLVEKTPHDQQSTEGEGRALAGSMAGAAGGAALGLVLAGPLGATTGALVGATSTPVFTFLAHLDVRRRQRAIQVVAETSERSGRSEEELAEWAATDPARADLLTAAVEGAARGGEQYPAKVLAMAQALAEGVLSDDAAILDHGLLVTRALEVLDRPHLLALQGLVEEEDEPGEWRHLVLSWEEWCARVPHYTTASMTRLEASLTREGMLEVYNYPVEDVEDPQLPNSAHQGKYFAVSEFGFDIFRRLHEIHTGAEGKSV